MAGSGRLVLPHSPHVDDSRLCLATTLAGQLLIAKPVAKIPPISELMVLVLLPFAATPALTVNGAILWLDVLPVPEGMMDLLSKLLAAAAGTRLATGILFVVTSICPVMHADRAFQRIKESHNRFSRTSVKSRERCRESRAPRRRRGE